VLKNVVVETLKLSYVVKNGCSSEVWDFLGGVIVLVKTKYIYLKSAV